MSKTTKAIAILGVVAGLGVAALPFNAMAAPTTNNGFTIHDGTGTTDATNKYDGTQDSKVEDTVTVRTTIDATLSMAIVGNSDGNDTETPVADHLVLLSADGNTDGKILNGGSASGKATVKVNTNHGAGYEVSIKGTNGGLKGKNTGKMIANLATPAADFPTTGASVYGFKASVPASVTTNGATFALSEPTNWQGVPTTATPVAKNTAATKAAGDSFDIEFKAYADDSQAADTYEDIVTVTAVAKLKAEGAGTGD